MITDFLAETKVFSSSVPRKNPLFRAVLPIFRASTSPWDNRNRFVSKKITKMQEMCLKNSFKSWRLDKSAGQCKLALLWVRSIYLLLNPLGLDFSTVIAMDTNRRQIRAQLRLQQKAVWAVQSAIKKIRSCWFIFKEASKINTKNLSYTPWCLFKTLEGRILNIISSSFHTMAVKNKPKA